VDSLRTPEKNVFKSIGYEVGTRLAVVRLSVTNFEAMMNSLNTNQPHLVRFDVAVAVLTIGMVFGAFVRFVA
jgi:hypothetical protein